MVKTNNFYRIVAEAVDDLALNGFDSMARVQDWERRLREAAYATLTPAHVLESTLRDVLANVYRKMVERGGVSKYHPGVNRYTIERIRPQLRAELDRRIMASANLIRLNREQAIQKTLQRFSGWSTSIPKGGSEAKTAQAKKDVRKALVRLPFEERRVLIDQGHKLTASINEVVATDNGALALRWQSNWRQAGYDYRPDHKERDGKVYLFRPSWALDKGLVKPGPAGYYDAITSVAEEPFCRCYATWIYTLRALPPDMLTERGREALRKAQDQIKAA